MPLQVRQLQQHLQRHQQDCPTWILKTAQHLGKGLKIVPSERVLRELVLRQQQRQADKEVGRGPATAVHGCGPGWAEGGARGLGAGWWCCVCIWGERRGGGDLISLLQVMAVWPASPVADRRTRVRPDAAAAAWHVLQPHR
jgi:hypothetical protein